MHHKSDCRYLSQQRWKLLNVHKMTKHRKRGALLHETRNKKHGTAGSSQLTRIAFPTKHIPVLILLRLEQAQGRKLHHVLRWK